MMISHTQVAEVCYLVRRVRIEDFLCVFIGVAIDYCSRLIRLLRSDQTMPPRGDPVIVSKRIMH